MLKNICKNSSCGIYFVLPAIIGTFIFIIIPIFCSFALSFTEWDLLNDIRFVGFENYKSIFKEAELGQTLSKAASATMNFGKTLITVFSNPALALGVAIITAAIAAIVATIASIGFGISNLIDHYNRATIAAEHAAEAHEKMKEAVTDAKSELDSITSAFNAYDDAVNKMNDCVKGTEEWQ